MTERSMLWQDNVGHGGPYSQDSTRLVFKALLGNPSANLGVMRGQLNALAVTSTGNNNVTVAPGRAHVDGTLYENDASLPITTASPTTGTTGRRVVLRKNWSARTVTAVVISSADGTAAIPALTQTDGATWEIPLAAFTITTAGVIGALTDQREYIDVAYSVEAARSMIANTRAILTHYEAMTVVNTSGAYQGGGLLLTLISSGVIVVSTLEPGGGRVQLQTGVTSGGAVRLNTSALGALAERNPRLLFRGRFGPGDAALAQQLVGLLGSAATNPADTATGVRIRSLTTGNLVFVTGDGTTATTTDLGPRPDTDDVWEIYTEDDGVSWQCARNRVVLARHTTNLPGVTVGLMPIVSVQNNTTTNVLLSAIDLLWCDQDRT